VPQELTHTELAERAYAAWNDDDLEAMLVFCHPEAEFIPSGVFPGLESGYPGKEGIRRWWETFHEPWREIKVIPERIAERPDGMDVLIRFEGLGRDGIETTMSFINKIDVRDGLLYRLVGHPASEEAIRELGLSA
jgi:ketosteroid isomerase-like protein